MSWAPVCIYACIFMYAFKLKHLIHTVKVHCRRFINSEYHVNLENALNILLASSLVSFFLLR